MTDANSIKRLADHRGSLPLLEGKHTDCDEGRRLTGTLEMNWQDNIKVCLKGSVTMM
jgi:hypothetical protein